MPPGERDYPNRPTEEEVVAKETANEKIGQAEEHALANAVNGNTSWSSAEKKWDHLETARKVLNQD